MNVTAGACRSVPPERSPANQSTVDLCPVAVLRSAGLPAALLDLLSDHALAAEVDRADDTEAARAATRAIEWADRALAALCRDPAVRAATAVANQDIHQHAVLPVADGVARRRRKRNRMVVALLQRLAAKNDTAAGYGPMDLVRFAGAADLVQPPAAPSRAGLVSWWVADLLGAAARRDPGVAAALPARLAGPVRRDGAVLRVGDRRVRLRPEEVAALDRRPLPAEPGGVAGDAADSALDRLRRAGLVHPALSVPAACTDPLAELISALPTGDDGERWADRLSELHAAAARIAEAPVQARPVLADALRRRVTELVGPLPQRPAAAFYTDREVFYEEGRGAAGEYRVGGRLAARIRTALQPACRLAAGYGYQLFLDASSVLRERMGPGRHRLVDVMGAVGELFPAPAQGGAGPGVPGEPGRAAGLRAGLDTLWPDGEAALDPDRLTEFLDRWPRPELSLLSPDLLLAADRGEPVGDADLVLGELHSNLQTFGLFEHFWPDSGMREWFAASGDLTDRLVQFVAPRSQGKAFLCELPTRSIEVGADARQPEAVRYGEVTVCWDGPTPWLELPDGQRRTLVPGDPSNPLYRALSPHTGLLPRLGRGPHTPQRSLGDLVVQREQWRLTRPAVSTRALADQFVQIRRWRVAHRLPERVFVRVASQPKPFCLDFRSPPLVDLLLHWTRPGELMVLTPMSPAADQLWLTRDDQRYCAELRISAVVRGRS